MAKKPAKDAEIARLRAELDASKDECRMLRLSVASMRAEYARLRHLAMALRDVNADLDRRKDA